MPLHLNLDFFTQYYIQYVKYEIKKGGFFKNVKSHTFYKEKKKDF